MFKYSEKSFCRLKLYKYIEVTDEQSKLMQTRNNMVIFVVKLNLTNHLKSVFM